MRKVLIALVTCLVASLLPPSGFALAPPAASASTSSPALVSASSSALATDIITIQNSIVIHRRPRTVFNFAANFLNDPYWREEVNAMTSNDQFGLGAVYLEDSHLGLKPNFYTETKIVALHPPSLVTAETTDSNPYYLKTSRRFQRWGWFSTRITYTIEFERAFIEATVGISLPDTLTEIYYNIRMREYLIRLKFLIETGIASFLSR